MMVYSEETNLPEASFITYLTKEELVDVSDIDINDYPREDTSINGNEYDFLKKEEPNHLKDLLNHLLKKQKQFLK